MDVDLATFKNFATFIFLTLQFGFHQQREKNKQTLWHH